MNADVAPTRRLNVLFIHQAAELYGSDRVLLYLVSGLVRRGSVWPIVVLPEMGPLWHALKQAGVEVHLAEIAKIKRSVFSPQGLLGLMPKIFSAMRQYDALVAGRPIALVHSNTLAVLVGAIWAWRRRVKHVWHVHEIILSPKVVSRAFPLLVRLGADRVMSNSTLTERWLLDYQPALKSRSTVVFNGLPEQAPAEPAEVAAFRVRAQTQPGGVLIVLAGRLSHLKGQALLVDAATLLKSAGLLGGAHFAIVGDTVPGQEAIRVQLLRQVAEAGLDDSFTFVSFIEDIRPAWQAADIAVVPSTEPESFGMVAIEAMAAGIPVVAAGHGGLLDIVEHERTGLLFEPRDAKALADALHRLISDAGLRRSYGAAGQLRQKQRFSAESQILSTEQVYVDMLRLVSSEQ